MRNLNSARALTRAQNSGPPFHKILDPPLYNVYSNKALLYYGYLLDSIAPAPYSTILHGLQNVLFTCIQSLET